VQKKRYKPEIVRLAFAAFAVGEPGSDGEQRMFCPICEDPENSNSPSASMNAESGLWNCLKSNHGGAISDLVADLKKERGWDIRSESMKARHKDPAYQKQVQSRLGNKPGAPLPGDETIQRWVDSLQSNKAALKAFSEQRGIENKTIIEWQIGWDGSRYTIPVRDVEGEIVNVRRYLMNAGHSDKMLNVPGHGTAMIFRPDILAANDDVVLTEGETDCILLNQEGVPAVTHTAGAGTFKAQWAQLFAGKTVWIAYDADDAGRKGAKKVESILSSFAANVHIIDIPETKKGADVTDYLFLEGHSIREFQELQSAALDKGGVAKVRTPVPTAGKHMSLKSSMAQSNQSEVIELVVSVAGKQQEPYTSPKRVTVTCDQSKGAACTLCPIAAKGGQAEFEIREDDEQLFRFVDVPEQRRRALIKEITGARCSDRAEFEVDENYHIEELLVQPSVDDRTDDESQEPVKRTVFSISPTASAVNSKVRVVGKNVTDPKTGKLRFMSWVKDAVEMDIDNFQLTPEMREALKTFQPSGDQTSFEKCLEIAQDMAENVTHIYGRDLLHVAYDLIWHSVLSFKVHDIVVEKGWLEAAFVGDTRTGKSEVATKFISHYNSGVLKSCEGMSFPGIVGGVQQIDGRWHMTWGVVPMNDRRLVVLDEVSGLKEKNVIEQMSSIRSSGRAQITKISSEETSARTRLAWIMNPADGSMLKDNQDAGMGALRTVVPNAEDIARFDFVVAAANTDVDASTINAGFGERHDPGYSSEECETLVKWVWSLTRDQINVTAAAAAAATNSALDLGKRYVSDPPFIQAENVRFKLLRIAAALAARTFSVDDSDRLLVEARHVDDAVEFLDSIYEQESLGYARMSRRVISTRERALEKKNRCRDYLREHEHDVLSTLRMLGGNVFRAKDFEEFGLMEKTEAKEVVNTFLKWGVAHRKTRGDVGMDAVLIDVIRELDDEQE
jgi:hypothetical protein